MGGARPTGRVGRWKATPWLSYAGSLAMGRLLNDHLGSHPKPPLWQGWRELFSAGGREKFVIRLKGIPHTAVRARPQR